jgi:hypothetical protein
VLRRRCLPIYLQHASLLAITPAPILQLPAAMQCSDCLFDVRCAALHLCAQRGATVLLNDVTLVLRGGVISVLLGPSESVATLFDCLRCQRPYLESCGLKIKGKVSFNVEVSEPLLKPELPFVATYFPGDEHLLPPTMTPREVLLWTARVRAAACSSAFASSESDVNGHLEQQLWVAGLGEQRDLPIAQLPRHLATCLALVRACSASTRCVLFACDVACQASGVSILRIGFVNFWLCQLLALSTFGFVNFWLMRFTVPYGASGGGACVFAENLRRGDSGVSSGKGAVVHTSVVGA